MRRVLVIAMGAAALVAVYLAVRGLTAQGGSEPAERQAPAFGASQRAAFSVLRGPTRPLPLPLQAKLSRARNPAVSGLRFDRARRVPTAAGIWVLNGPGDTCVVEARGGAVACESRAALVGHGITLGVVDLGPPPARKPRAFVLLGLAPDWVEAVRVKVGKRTRLIPVEKNTYSLRAPVPILVKRLEPT